MKKIFGYIICGLMVMPLLQGCFKDVVSYTRYTAAVYNQTESNGEFTPATEIESYAFYVDTTDWKIASYEDALARRLTNKITGQTLSEPDVEGEFNPDENYQVALTLESETSMIVFVNPTLRLYAYRKYTLPVNMPEVLTKLYMAQWRNSHSASGWRVVNDFYTPPVPATPTPPADDEGQEGNEGNEGNEGDDTPTEGEEDTPAEPTEEDDENTAK